MGTFHPIPMAPKKAQDNNQDQNSQQLHVHVPAELQTGVFSNAASVTVTPNEVTVDFGFLLPNVNPSTIHIASRVTMTHVGAKNFLSTLQNAILDYENKRGQA